jgi:hypothetical protein
MKKFALLSGLIFLSLVSGCTYHSPEPINLDATIQAGISSALEEKDLLDQAKLDQSQQTQNTQIAAEVDQKVSSLATEVYLDMQENVLPEIGGTPTLSVGSGSSSAACTNKFEFLSDVTFPDGTMTLPLTTFTKSWYVQNTGTCEWTKYYSIVYLSGDNVGTAKEFPLFTSDKLLKNGESAIISVIITAPEKQGEYSTYWALKSPDGQIFKGGDSAEGYPLSSKFKVGSQYNFYENLSGAICSDDSGLFFCGSSDRSSGRGVAYYSASPTVESNYAGQPSIVIGPPLKENGKTRVTFGPIRVPRGTWLRAAVSCPPNAPGCDNFVRLFVQVEGSTEQRVTETQENNDGYVTEWNIQLSDYGYHDQSLTYTFEVQANGGSDADDLIIIQMPRLTDVAPVK